MWSSLGCTIFEAPKGNKKMEHPKNMHTFADMVLVALRPDLPELLSSIDGLLRQSIQRVVIHEVVVLQSLKPSWWNKHCSSGHNLPHLVECQEHSSPKVVMVGFGFLWPP